MAQLFFRYGAMNSGKTIEILKVAHNYEEQAKSVIIMTSGLDNRDEVGYVSSRIGMKRKAVPVFDEDNMYDKVMAVNPKAACVLVDEAQFLKKHHILELTKVVDELNIPVMTFGLKNDFQNELFEGSKYLLLYADKIEEMKTICWFCAKKATMNLRVNNGRPVYAGEQIAIGGNESYYPVCRKHYFAPPVNEAQIIVKENN
ncbi:thymidine kinase [Ligilactobacillus sp. WC1T17]|uniref:Thymidine kinase n=1 Tax=Ligilactobacillus ruminis TaxID=1623 RepID=A0ABY1AAN2_9LACO|nr:thymidine kinase [Ligilactobacillus ruminis]